VDWELLLPPWAGMAMGGTGAVPIDEGGGNSSAGAGLPGGNPGSINQ
jgi:hypothetical protein